MKYSIIHVNDRCKDLMNKNKNILYQFEYVDDIEYINGNVSNAWDILNHRGIKMNVWKPYDGRTSDPLPGEYGIWASTLNVLDYIVHNNIGRFLLLEDDVLLDNDFVNKLDLVLNELPSDFDFLSLYYFEEQNELDENTEIGAKYIHKSLNQYSAAQAMIYSLSGAKKILKAVNRVGIQYTSDCFIFKHSHIGVLNGYSIKPDELKFLTHEYKSIRSIIDPENVRETPNL